MFAFEISKYANRDKFDLANIFRVCVYPKWRHPREYFPWVHPKYG